MKSILVISDSFKGSLSSEDIANLFIENNPYNLDIKTFCIADGGEGTVKAISKYIPGSMQKITVKGPYLKDMEVEYYISNDEAFIEMSSSSGLPLVLDNKNPSKTFTIGIGQQILDAISKGCKTIYLGLGGSCTNDGGAGIAYALGYKFYDKDGNEIIPNGGNLIDIVKIDSNYVDSRIKNVNFIGLCDVNSVMCGVNGSSRIYGPQKGADPEMVLELEKGMANLNNLFIKYFFKDCSTIVGGGAAGSVGAGIYGFFNGKLISGINFFLDKINFSEVASKVDYVITGEGSFDSQSFKGKVISGILKRTTRVRTPVIIICGLNRSNIIPIGVAKIYSLVNEKVSREMSLENPKKYYIEAIMKFYGEHR